MLAVPMQTTSLYDLEDGHAGCEGSSSCSFFLSDGGLAQGSSTKSESSLWVNLSMSILSVMLIASGFRFNTEDFEAGISGAGLGRWAWDLAFGGSRCCSSVPKRTSRCSKLTPN